RPPDVPVLRLQRGARLPGLAAAVAAGGAVAAEPGAPGAGTVPPVRAAVAGRPAAAGPCRLDAVALVAARRQATAADGAVRGRGVAAADLRPVCRAVHRLRADRGVLARARACARAVRRLLRQRAGGDGHAGDPGPLRARAVHAGGGLVRLRRD